jgi:hypothetical protein
MMGGVVDREPVSPRQSHTIVLKSPMEKLFGR